MEKFPCNTCIKHQFPGMSSLVYFKRTTHIGSSVSDRSCRRDGFTLGPEEYPRLGKDRHKEKCQTRETFRDYRA